MNQQNEQQPEIVKGPKALFWFLTLFFALDVVAPALGGMWFQFINKWLPINVGQAPGSFSQEAIKMEIASLIVAAPVFYLMCHLIRKALRKGSMAADNKVRLWITYIILFLVVAISAGDLIRTVFALLNGDYTVRFLLKALVILIIAAYIFCYYWPEARSKTALVGSKRPKIMGLAALAAIVVSVVAAFFLIDTPAVSRVKAFDRARAQKLQEIKYTIDNYYYEYKKLPASLDELRQSRGLNIVDEETGKQFEYRIMGNESYELCADFKLSNKNLNRDDQVYFGDASFLYDAGRNCFTRNVSQTDKIGIPNPIPAK